MHKCLLAEVSYPIPLAAVAFCSLIREKMAAMQNSAGNASFCKKRWSWIKFAGCSVENNSSDVADRRD